VGLAFAIALVAWAWAAQAQDIPTSNAVAANRVVIQFEGGNFTLLERLELRTILPPSDELPDSGRELSGFWYELRDSAGSLLYRRIIESPVTVRFEGPATGAGGEPPEDAEGATAERIESIPERTVFSLLIPAASDGDQLVLFSSPLEEGQQFRAATEVARFDLLPIIF
jgi:hypothetical protein